MTKTKAAILTLLAFGLSYVSTAQSYGNEWINFSQSYYKFKLAEDGIYRISRNDLINGGFPVGSINPRKIQLFYLGQEQAIKVEGEGDGVFDNSDFIEFYGRKSDGTTDTDLYITPEAQPHTRYDIFTDSSAYFLTFALDLTNGLRIEEFFENNSGGLPPENYFFDSQEIINTDRYYPGQSYGFSDEVLQGYYDLGEGWTGNSVRDGLSISHTLMDLGNWVDDSTFPTLEMLLSGANNNQHNVTIFVGPNSGSVRLIHTAEFSGDETHLVNENLQWSDISSEGELFIRATVNGVNGVRDRAAISYIELRYSRDFDFDGITEQKIELRANPGNKSFIQISNPPSDALLYDITEPYEPISIEYSANISAIVDNTSSSRTLLVQSGTKTIPGIREIDFEPIDATDYNYTIITHPQLRENTSDGDPDPVTTYKEYRESGDGGGHNVLILEIEDVFNQFNFGNPSPLAIRKYCQYMYQEGEGNLEFLFLIGKASNVGDNYYRQDPDSTSLRHLVPTYGHPGADVPFSTGFDGGIAYETISTGRINANSPDDVLAYLNKVIEKESTRFTTLRQKNMVHLSGGNSENELVTFQNYIDNYAAKAGQKWVGAESAQISKNSNEAVQLFNISDEVNEGVMMVTFFGHSSLTVTDIEIGLVSDPSFGYANKGKYPVFLVNGCLAGEFFSESESFGVDWILTPDLGATAFMANSHVAFASYLNRYTNIFYDLAFNDPEYITKTIGEIKKETGRRLIEAENASSFAISQVQLVNLQGDPAVRVFGADKPDFSIDPNLIEFYSFDGGPILANADSFLVSFNVKNFGIATDSLLSVGVERTLADGSRISYSARIYEPTLREDTLSFVIANNLSQPGGNNTFQINLDPFSSIDELDELNNSATVDLFLIDGSTLNLLPEPFGIVNTEEPVFFFQSSNILTDSREYDFQIDVVSSFNSSSLISQSLSTEVVGRLSIDLTRFGSIPDGTVFFWRTRFSDPLPNESNEWTTSSFTLDRTKTEGYSNQSTVQLSNLSLDGLSIDESNGIWEFLTTQLNIQVNGFGPNHPTMDFDDTQVIFDSQDYFATNSPLGNAHCSENSINFVAFKRQSAVPFQPFFFSSPPELNAWICGRLPQYIFDYVDSEMDGTYGPNAFIDILENGDKVLIFSLGTVQYSTWSDEFKSNLETLGVDPLVLENLVDGEPIIILGSKNAPANSATIVRAGTAPADQAAVSLNENVIGNFDSGTITTPKIGPAVSWQQFSMDIIDSDNPSDDLRNIQLVGIDNEGNESTVYQSTSETTIDLSPTGINLDPDNYPYLRLILELEDNVQFTPPQLQNWEIEYETAPELVLIKPERTDLESINPVQEGAPFNSQFTIWNISDKGFMDSLNVNFNLFTIQSATASDESTKVAPLAAGDSVQVSLELNTRNKLTVNDLIVSVNKGYEKEKYLINNEIRLTNYLDVKPDTINPVLDVTFDGVIIMDEDIVSPNPTISVSISDENPFILNEDTLGINLYLRRPCEDCILERVAFSNPQVQWTPATPESSFEIQYNPELIDDGMYTFEILAADGTGNESGLEPYNINFQVINESTITNFYPYPNPFSTRTQFVFTLTGSEIPEDLKIQILTVSGRVVREIFMNELGPIRIGNNKTEFAWDGTDNYGDALANGVYLYRVLIKNPGSDFEHRETAGDRGFKNGFGKMYILR